jgi:hypothetical protein
MPSIHGGQQPFQSLNDGERDAMLAPPPEAGFIIGCLPSLCTWHFSTLSDKAIRHWFTDAEAREFLSPIDTHAEVMLLARAAGYHFEATDTRRRGIARAGDEFFLLATHSQLCPRIDFRVALRMDATGQATELGRELAHDFQSCVEI